MVLLQVKWYRYQFGNIATSKWYRYQSVVSLPVNGTNTSQWYCYQLSDTNTSPVVLLHVSDTDTSQWYCYQSLVALPVSTWYRYQFSGTDTSQWYRYQSVVPLPVNGIDTSQW